jgi:superfamily II DNA or RNA helicase
MDVTQQAGKEHGPSPIPLRPYQRDALAAIAQTYVRGIRRPLVSVPTGCGKNAIFS